MFSVVAHEGGYPHRECPFPGCNYTANTLNDLRNHMLDDPMHTCIRGWYQVRTNVNTGLCVLDANGTVVETNGAIDANAPAALRFTGRIYASEWSDGRIEEGRFPDANSKVLRFQTVYEGECKGKTKHGKGEAYGSDGGVEFKGRWEDDKPAEGTWYDETGCVVHEGKRDGSETA